MKIKVLAFLYFLGFIEVSLAQLRTQELGLLTDNDLYTSSKNDKYYTNGLFIFYRYLGKSTSEDKLKTTNEFKLGQKVFTPRFLNKEAVDICDRPFAGYLFGSFLKANFYKNQSVFKYGFEVGVVGPNSYAKEFQENFHHAFGYKEVFGWENQIRNTVAIQTHFLYSKRLDENSNQSVIDLNWVSEADLGTCFTGMSSGFLTRIGFKKLLPISSSTLFDGQVGTESQANNEFYFFLHPSLRYQAYDATIQGSMFSDTSPVTFNVKPIRFNARAGLSFRSDNWNMSYTFIYSTKEVESPATGYFYGSIGLSYLLQ